MRFNTLHHIHKMLQNCWRKIFLNTQNPVASGGGGGSLRFALRGSLPGHCPEPAGDLKRFPDPSPTFVPPNIKFLYFFIISSLFPYLNLFVSIFIQSYVNIKLHVSTNNPKIYNYRTFLTLSLKLMQLYVTSVIRGSLSKNLVINVWKS